jgi:hypothetical protein
MNKLKKFKSPDGSDRRVVSDDGCSIIVVNDAWQKVPAELWEDCYAMGCISEDMLVNSAVSSVDQSVQETITKVHARKDAIKTEILKIIHNNEIEAFDAHGRPKATLLTERLGFRVTGPERDEALHMAKQEIIE